MDHSFCLSGRVPRTAMLAKITALEAQKKNRHRVNVYLDGRFAFGLQEALAFPLKVGQTLSPEEMKQLQERDEAEVAYERALSFLSYRPRSRAEIEGHLRRKEASAAVVQTVVARLTQAGLLDDQAFAQYWVENREQFRPRGARSLRFELRLKGVSDSLAEQAVEVVDETESAYRAAQARAQRLRGLEREVFRRRLGGFLQRRGFNYEVVKETVERLWKELQTPTGEDPF